MRYIDALLGPERTRECLSLGKMTTESGGHADRIISSLLGVVGMVVAVAGFCVLFENCTVDASIFVSKCVRAHGGCLGTRSR